MELKVSSLFLIFIFVPPHLIIITAELNNNEPPQQNPEEPPPPSLFNFASSPILQVQLAQLDYKIYNLLNQYEEHLVQRLQIIQKYKEDYASTVLQPYSYPDLEDWHTHSQLVSNPLIVYKMMERYSILLKDFYQDIGKGVETQVFQTLEGWRWRPNYLWPNEEDLGDVAQAIFHLQYVYDIPAEQIADGSLLLPYHHPSILTSKDCYALATLAMQIGDSLRAGDWLKAAKTRLETDGLLDFSSFISLWEKAVHMHGKIWNIDDLLLHQEQMDVFSQAQGYLRLQYEERKHNVSVENRIHNFQALCRGDDNPKKLRLRVEKCYVLRNLLGPYFTINPQYIEVHNRRNPRIIQVHDHFEGSLIQDVSNTVFHPLVRAATKNPENQNKDLKNRGNSAWVMEKVPRLIKAVEKLERIFGLKIHEVNEDPTFYMQSFSPGHGYEPCVICDPQVPYVLNDGRRRVATAEFVMDNTEFGGDLAFTQLSLRVRPTKGSVIIIFEEDAGEDQQAQGSKSNYRLLRGSCPVLLGQKWVGSKLIYGHGQTLRLPPV